MPLENRRQTVTDFESELSSASFNEFQDRLEMLQGMTESTGAVAGALPTSLRGGVWLYQQIKAPANTSAPIDLSYAYWGGPYAPWGTNLHDWRNRACLLFFVKTDGAPGDNFLPSGATHDPSLIAAADMAWTICNLKSTARTWKPMAAWNLYIYADDDGGLWYDNQDGSIRYFWFYFLITKPLTAETVTLHRPKSMARYARFNAGYYNEHQDRGVMLWEANQEEGTLPATFLGATTLYGEFTIADGTDILLDDSRDWRDSLVLMHYATVATAVELPSGANHDPDNVLTPAWELWCTKAGVAVGGPFGAGTAAWEPLGNDVAIYADNVNGYLYATNWSGAPEYFYLMARFAPKIS